MTGVLRFGRSLTAWSFATPWDVLGGATPGCMCHDFGLPITLAVITTRSVRERRCPEEGLLDDPAGERADGPNLQHGDTD